MAKKRPRQRKPATRPAQSPESGSGGSLLGFIHSHATLLATTPRSLCSAAEISESVIKNWSSGRSQPSALQLNALAKTISSLWDKTGSLSPEYRGTSRLPTLLGEIYNAAGREIVAFQSPANLVWNEVFDGNATGSDDEQHRRPLRVGFFEWPPLAWCEHGVWHGLAWDVMRQLSLLLGIEFTPVHVPWPNSLYALIDGTCDVIAPLYLRLPYRLRDVEFTLPLPGFRCHVNAIVSRSYLPMLGGTGDSGMALDDFLQDRARFCVGKSRITRTLADLLRSLSSQDKVGAYDTQPFKTITHGWESVLEHPTDDGLVRVFPTESLTCVHASRQSSRALAPVLKLDSMTTPSLGVSLAVRPNEPKLIDVLNSALTELSRNPEYLVRLYGRNGRLDDYLLPAHALSPELADLHA